MLSAHVRVRMVQRASWRPAPAVFKVCEDNELTRDPGHQHFISQVWAMLWAGLARLRGRGAAPSFSSLEQAEDGSVLQPPHLPAEDDDPFTMQDLANSSEGRARRALWPSARKVGAGGRVRAGQGQLECGVAHATCASASLHYTITVHSAGHAWLLCAQEVEMGTKEQHKQLLQQPQRGGSGTEAALRHESDEDDVRPGTPQRQRPAGRKGK